MNTAVALVEDTDELSCVLVPSAGVNLLMPNVSVAEIVPWRRLRQLPKAPPWCIGVTAWRGRNVPVIHYLGFGENAPVAPRTARCLVIMNRTNSRSGPEFYAFAAHGLPRMLQLVDEDVIPNEDQPVQSGAMCVNVGMESAVIPDLANIEDRVIELIASIGG